MAPTARTQVIQDYCRLTSLSTPEIVVEEASAKSIRGRPELFHILQMCRARQVKHVIIQDLTRLFRDVREALNVIYEREDGMGVRFHSATQLGPDPTTADGEMIRNIRLVYGRYERRRIGERTRAALRRMKTPPGGTPLLDARADQGKLVTGRAPYGFRWQDGDLVENAPETKMVVIIRAWAGQADRPTVIAAKLNHQGYSTRSRGRWHHHQVSRILGRPY